MTSSLILLRKIEKVQGQADSLYRNIKNNGFDLPKASQNNTGAKCAKTLTGVFAALAISGCVSQQSAFEFNGTPAVQPVATGVTLGGAPLEPVSANAATPTLASNVPVRAPRPSADVATLTVVQASTASAAPATATNEVPVPTGTLAVVETPDQPTPTANVIADAVTEPQTPVAAVPSPKPATIDTAQTQNAVEVASLSPTVEAAPTVQTPQAPVVKNKGLL